jgi:hypothetical protein
MSLVNALEDHLAAVQIVIIRGDAPQVEHWSSSIHRVYAPTRMIFAIPRDAAELPPALAAKRAMAETVAYVCNGMACSAPLTELGEIARQLAIPSSKA